MSLDSLKPLAEVLQPDERWRLFSGSLEDHHRLIASIQVNASAPEAVRQQFENARNVWLYAYFAYSLLTVAMSTLHVACEMAVKARAERESLSGWKRMRFAQLLDAAIDQRWLVDVGFAAAERREAARSIQRELIREIGGKDIGPFVSPTDDQEYSRVLMQSIRRLRNDLAHGENLLDPNLSPSFQVVADFINQLFPHGPNL